MYPVVSSATTGDLGGKYNRKAGEAARASRLGELERPAGLPLFLALHQGSTVTQPYMPPSRCGRIPQTTR